MHQFYRAPFFTPSCSPPNKQLQTNSRDNRRNLIITQCQTCNLPSLIALQLASFIYFLLQQLVVAVQPPHHPAIMLCGWLRMAERMAERMAGDDCIASFPSTQVTSNRNQTSHMFYRCALLIITTCRGQRSAVSDSLFSAVKQKYRTPICRRCWSDSATKFLTLTQHSLSLSLPPSPIT